MNDDIKRVITGKVRLSYVNLITPRAQKQGDKLKYSTTLLIPKSDIATKQRIDAAMNAAIQEGIVTKWNGQGRHSLRFLYMMEMEFAQPASTFLQSAKTTG